MTKTYDVYGKNLHVGQEILCAVNGQSICYKTDAEIKPNYFPAIIYSIDQRLDYFQIIVKKNKRAESRWNTTITNKNIQFIIPLDREWELGENL